MALLLPALITMADYGHNWDEFYAAVYAKYCEDFIYNPIEKIFGRRLSLKKNPLVDNKAYTFYHITHAGKDEENREPDIRRMERIAWVKEILLNCDSPELWIWKNQRGKNQRICIYHPAETYLVIIEEREDYNLLWTAYIVDFKSQRIALEKEYKAYINAEAG